MTAPHPDPADVAAVAHFVAWVTKARNVQLMYGVDEMENARAVIRTLEQQAARIVELEAERDRGLTEIAVAVHNLGADRDTLRARVEELERANRNLMRELSGEYFS